MLKSFLVLTAATGFALGCAAPASAFLPNQSPMVSASKELTNTIEVKWKFKKAKTRPPGWDRGRKVGWRGFGVPPGQRFR